MSTSEAQRPSVLVAVSSLFLALSWFVVALRFYVRQLLVKAVGADDWTSLVGLFLVTWLNIGSILNARAGFGLHIGDIPLSHFQRIFLLFYLNSIAYIFAMAVIKISICLSLKRIAIDRKHIWIIYITAILTILSGIITCAMSIFQCSPVPYFWMRFEGAEGHCLPEAYVQGMAWAQSAVAIITDWTLAILPIFIIKDLKMKPSTIISVYLVLSLGSIACIATIVRLPTIKGLTKTMDFTYKAYHLGILSVLEPSIGLTASCLVTLRPLLRKIFHATSVVGESTASLETRYLTRTKSSFQQLNHVDDNGRGETTLQPYNYRTNRRSQEMDT